MVSSAGVPNDERKGRRLGDETKERIADLASGWTVDEPPAPPEPRREPPRARTKSLPPPPPGSAQRKARPPAPRAAPVDLSAMPESDRTKENRGAVGIKHDKSASLTTNAASGTIGDTPAPLFDRAAIAAGQKANQSSDRLPAQSVRSTGSMSTAATENSPARGTPKPGARLTPLPSRPATDSALDDLLDDLPGDDDGEDLAAPVAPIRHDARDDVDFADGDDAATSIADDPAEHADRASGRLRRSLVEADEDASDAFAEQPTDFVGKPTLGHAAAAPAAPAVDDEEDFSLDAPLGPPEDSADDSVDIPMDDSVPAMRPPPAVAAAPRRATPVGLPLPRSPASGPVPVAAPAARSQPVPAAVASARSQPVAAPLSVMRTGPVPIGEFEQGASVVEPDKLRAAYSHATVKRDTASALLGIPELAKAPATPPPEAAKPARPAPGGSTSPLVSTKPLAKAEADPTFGNLLNELSGPPAAAIDDTGTSIPASDDTGASFAAGDYTDDPDADATKLSPSAATSRAPAGKLRQFAALPRRPGFAGDLRYVVTVVFGLRAARRELGELLTKQTTRQQSRRHHLVTLGRTAVQLVEAMDPAARPDAAEHAALAPAREQLAVIDEDRTRHADQIAEADGELAEVRRDRDAAAKQFASDTAAIDAELAANATKLAPLAKQAAKLRKRGAKLHEAVRRIDSRIAALETALRDGNDKLDRAASEAEIATLRADRKTVQADEPAIAADYDALSPRIAALEAARSDAEHKRTDLVAADQEDQRRVDELLVSIGAQRKVVDRAAAAAEARRDKVLFGLGEQLCVDRPGSLMPQLSPIDAIDVELGSADRRIMELREILTSVDRFKLARSVLWLVLILGALGAAAWFVVPMVS